jgi:hypothetical protein
MSPDSGPDYRQQQEAQEREQQEAWEALEWWETHHICQSYGTQQGIATAPGKENHHGIHESGTEEKQAAPRDHWAIGEWEDPWRTPDR